MINILNTIGNKLIWTRDPETITQQVIDLLKAIKSNEELFTEFNSRVKQFGKLIETSAFKKTQKKFNKFLETIEQGSYVYRSNVDFEYVDFIQYALNQKDDNITNYLYGSNGLYEKYIFIINSIDSRIQLPHISYREKIFENYPFYYLNKREEFMPDDQCREAYFILLKTSAIYVLNVMKHIVQKKNIILNPITDYSELTKNLTPREREAFMYIVVNKCGHSELREHMNIKESTVKSYINNISKKLKLEENNIKGQKIKEIRKLASQYIK